MAVPKFRTSKSKRDMRRAHDFLTPPGISTCANCGSVRRPHSVCTGCGHYKGKQVMAAKTSAAWQGEDFTK
ncbi:MAG: 50S ribosomal protein L32 [Proteobacteria bacterium]|nr:50S ribosomal protein L32 [Pseudomonadota bacterium]